MLLLADFRRLGRLAASLSSSSLSRRLFLRRGGSSSSSSSLVRELLRDRGASSSSSSRGRVLLFLGLSSSSSSSGAGRLDLAGRLGDCLTASLRGGASSSSPVARKRVAHLGHLMRLTRGDLRIHAHFLLAFGTGHDHGRVPR